MSNQAAMARRQRERARKQQAQEKLAKREERREQKSKTGPMVGDDPMNDPTIDWGDAVREQPIIEETTPDESQS